MPAMVGYLNHWATAARLGMNGDAVRKEERIRMMYARSMNEFAVKDVRVNKNTVVDWYMFCREVCMAAVLKESEPLGGEGKNC
ncbi:hypothetical protein TNCV_5058211 [Trichonephila clavipes]|nr:hypothetical protein TNCV_5058211 [Trichonephila clavipes]